jgi:hypothetical protein
MYAPRPPADRIDRYAGPYERWLWSGELGRPYAFPALHQPGARLMAAILDGPGDPRRMGGADVRLPPLWPPGADHAVTPFVFRDTADPAEDPDRSLARCLGTLSHKVAPRLRLNLPVPPASWVADHTPEAAAAGWQRPATAPRAIVGVIDDGIPFAHQAFLGQEGRTRISHLWLQSARAAPRDRVPVGRELTNGAIDALRAAHGLDERRLYRAAGAVDAALPEIGRLLDRAGTHGAHILGLAGGNGPHLRAPLLDDGVQIIAVQLPNTVAWDTSGFGKEMFMLSALHYIFVRASEIAAACGTAELPLVVNLSYGWSAGRHDGQSEMETAIEQLLLRRRRAQPQTAVVLPSGNTFGERMHAVCTGADMGAGQARLGWRLPPDDRTSSYLELWLPRDIDPTGWEVRVTPPPGIALDRPARMAVAPDPELDPRGDPRRHVEIERHGRNIGQISADLHRGTRWRILIALIPTAETGTERRLPPGLWQVAIDPGKGCPLRPDQRIEAWVQRDDDPRQMRMGGRQSRLEPGHGFVVTGFGSLSAIATTPSATRVAGIVAADGTPSPYSSAGSLFPGSVVPTVCAPSDVSALHPGLRSIGTLSGSSSRLAGTSAAAALAARIMVANAARGLPLLAGAAPLPHGPDTEPGARLGHARLVVRV